MPKAWIINFGNELLIGRIVNTNGAWLAEKLTLLGVTVRRIIVAPDDEEAVEVLRDALRNADIIICTGGLGPTYDDRTSEFLAKALGRRLVENEAALSMVKEKYSKLGLPLTPERRKMALLPEGAEPIPNPVGTAPGILLRLDGKIVACLPGVPDEMKKMFELYVKRVITKFVTPPCIYEASIIVEGVPESTLAPILKRVVKTCTPPCYVKSHPRGREVENPVIDVRIQASGRECSEVEERIRSAVKTLINALHELGGRIVSTSIRRLSD